MLNIDKCFYVLTWSHSFYPLFFFDVVYPVYWYLDVEPSLPLVSTFHLPLPVSGARLQALTITACTSRVLSALQMPVPLVSLPGILGWWAPLLRVPESQPLALWGVWRVNGKPGCMGLCLAGFTAVDGDLFAELHSSIKPHPSPGHCSPGLL